MNTDLFFWIRGEGGDLSPHFHATEFTCRCGDCYVQCVDLGLIESLELLRIQFSKPIFITSGFRCFYHNRASGGSTNSLHLSGLAADIKINGIDTETIYMKAKSLFKGLGLAKSFLHVDKRLGEPAFWTYK